MLTGLIIALLLASNARIEEEARRARTAEANEHAAADNARAAEAEKTLQLGLSLLKQGRANQTSGDLGQRFESLAQLRQAAETLRSHPQGGEHLAEVRDQMIAALALTDLRRTWERQLDKIMCVSCDADLERYACDDPFGGDLVVRRRQTGEELARMPRPKADFWYMAHDFSPDGRYLWVTYRLRNGGALPNNLLHVWDLVRKEKVFDGETRCEKVCFHPDGKRMLYSVAPFHVAVWDLEARREQRRLLMNFVPSDLALSPDGSLVVGAFPVGSGVYLPHALLDVETGERRGKAASRGDNLGLSWRADGQVYAVGRRDGVVDVCSAAGLVSQLRGHSADVIGVRFAPAGNQLATWSWDASTKLWDAATGDCLVTLPGRYLRYSRDGLRLAHLDGNRLMVLDVGGGQEYRVLAAADQGTNADPTTRVQATAADFSPDGRLLAVADGGSVPRLFNTASGVDLGAMKATWCESVRFHPDGHTLAWQDSEGIHTCPVSEGERDGHRTVRVGPPALLSAGNFDGWRRFTWLPGGKGLAAVDNSNGRVLLLDAAAPPGQAAPPAELRSIHKRMTSITVSPNGQWTAAGGWKEPWVQVWDLKTRRLARRLPASDGKHDPHTFTAFSPDGRWLVSLCRDDRGGRYTFWRTDTWEPGLVIEQEGTVAGAAPAAFTADGRVMALALSSRRVLLADAATGTPLAHLTTRLPLVPVPLAFSPDGTRLVAATNRRSVLMWDLRHIRAALAAANLDWSAEPLPPENDGGMLCVTIDGAAK